MAAKRKPRCFVAMAFDHDDTDALYERAIAPVLKSNGVVPVIINRRQDNRDINHQIIEQLNACDFCITDLTYTRPSVYFEAGYAQRAVEVIYTVRSDHLSKNQPDNLRVHFDLQMKPLIKWSTPADTTFPVRLEKRIRSTVLRKWDVAQAADERLNRKREEFTHMPLSDRLSGLRTMTLSDMKAQGFAKWEPLIGHYGRRRGFFSPAQLLRNCGSCRWLMSRQQVKRNLAVASLGIEETLTLTTLRDNFRSRFIGTQYLPHLDGHEMIEVSRPVDHTVEHHILISIRDVPQSRIMSALPTLRWEPECGRYFQEVEWRYEGKRWLSTRTGRKGVDVKLCVLRSINVYFIAGIRSFPEFKEQLSGVLGQMEGNQQDKSSVRGKSRR
jgi:hypothetical protein